jgi:hypothetical protein
MPGTTQVWQDEGDDRIVVHSLRAHRAEQSVARAWKIMLSHGVTGESTLEGKCG